MDYATLKLVHQGAVAMSITGFVARGVLALRDSPLARTRVARTVPHVVDTLLLASAIGMLTVLHLNPLQQPWLVAKLCGLVVYIGLGVLALRPGRSGAVRGAAWLGALATVAWIVSVALTKSPLGFLAGP